MDHIVEAIAAFASELSADVLTPDLLHITKRRLVDTYGCMIGGASSTPVTIARSLAAETSGARSATAIGLQTPSTVEMAAFTNSVAARCLDFNDTYASPRGGGGHPSDLIPAALALGEAYELDGFQVLLSIVLGYEVLGRLAGTGRLRERGWDQGLWTTIAAAMIAGKLLACTRGQLAQAVSLAITPNVPTRETRSGELAMWKGCATAEAIRNGLFAASLAKRGLTGPPMPFQGHHGICDQVAGDITLDMPPHPDQFVIEDVHTKYRPAENNAQGVLDLGFAIGRLVDLADIEEVLVETYWLAYSEIGSEPAKWDPQTRETADHSIPYLLASILRDGEVTLSSFSPERILDPSLRPLMNRIRVVENKEYSKRYPEEFVTRVVVRTTDGALIERETSFPKGHIMNPLSDEEVENKFFSLIATRAPREVRSCKELLARLWKFDEIPDVSEVVRPLGFLRT